MPVRKEEEVEPITHKQLAKAEKEKKRRIAEAVKELKVLLKMPEVKDIIGILVLATRSPSRSTYTLQLTNRGLEERYQYDARPSDVMAFDEDRTEKVSVKYLASYVESYNLSAAQIISFQKRLK